MKNKMTFIEGLRVSWQRELQIGKPSRILNLAFFTVYYSFVYFFFVYAPRVIARALIGDTDWKK